MDCFHDFCLACDRESTTGPYCSQACRLADLEKATSSAPSSPGAPSSHSYERSWRPSSTASSSSGYCLPQAYKFPDPATSSTHHIDQSRSRPTSSSRPTRQQPLDLPEQRSLTPSSSRTSLSSNASHSNPNSMSAQAKHELQEYFSAFHHTKSSKRRQSTW